MKRKVYSFNQFTKLNEDASSAQALEGYDKAIRISQIISDMFDSSKSSFIFSPFKDTLDDNEEAALDYFNEKLIELRSKGSFKGMHPSYATKIESAIAEIKKKILGNEMNDNVEWYIGNLRFEVDTDF